MLWPSHLWGGAIVGCLGWHASLMLHGGLGLCELAAQGSGSHISKGGPEVLLKLSGCHTSHPPWESLCQGTGKESRIDCQTLDTRRAMRILSCPWNRGPTLYPCKTAQGVMGVCPSSLRLCVLWIWRRHMTCPSESLVGGTERIWVTRAIVTYSLQVVKNVSSWCRSLPELSLVTIQGNKGQLQGTASRFLWQLQDFKVQPRRG